MPTVFLPLRICLPLLAVSVVCLAILARQYLRTVMTIRPVLARLLAEDYEKDSRGKLLPGVIMASFPDLMDKLVKKPFGYKFEDSAEYRNLVSRAQIFYWLSVLSFVAVVISLGLTLQDLLQARPPA